MFRKLIDSIYYKGFEAGYTACKVDDLKKVTEIAEMAYDTGYEEGREDAKAEIGEIDLDDLPM